MRKFKLYVLSCFRLLLTCSKQVRAISCNTVRCNSASKLSITVQRGNRNVIKSVTFFREIYDPSNMNNKRSSTTPAARCPQEETTRVSLTCQCCRVWRCNQVHYGAPEGPNRTCVIPLKSMWIELVLYFRTKSFLATDGWRGLCGSAFLSCKIWDSNVSTTRLIWSDIKWPLWHCSRYQLTTNMNEYGLLTSRNESDPPARGRLVPNRTWFSLMIQLLHSLWGRYKYYS